jgi:hypothetical protein
MKRALLVDNEAVLRKSKQDIDWEKQQCGTSWYPVEDKVIPAFDHDHGSLRFSTFEGVKHESS